MEGNTTIKQENMTENKPQAAERTDTNARLDYMGVKHAAMTLRAVNHKLRQNIVKLLEDHKRMNVTDIYVKLRLEQSVASQHLAILRRAGIVITEREGKFIHYTLNGERIRELSQFVTDLQTSGERHVKPHTRAPRQTAPKQTAPKEAASKTAAPKEKASKEAAPKETTDKENAATAAPAAEATPATAAAPAAAEVGAESKEAVAE